MGGTATAEEPAPIRRYRDHAREVAGKIRSHWEHSGREDLKTLVDDVHVALVEEAAQELRQVLFQLSASMELAVSQRRSGKEGPSDQTLERMRDAVARATRIVDVYLDRNNAVQSVIPLSPEPFDIGRALNEVLRINGFLSVANKITFAIKPVTVVADRIRLIDVLSHLITRFYFAGRGTAILHVALDSDAEDCTGFIGLAPSPIPTQDLMSEFNKPFAIDSMEMDTPYCRAVIERHGGSLYVAERDGATGFGFILPLKQES